MTQDVSEWRRSWRVLTSASVGNALGFGLFVMTAGLFIIPMQEEFGWSRSAISIGPIVTLFAALLSPFGGLVIDRFGARRLAIVGLLALAASYVLLAVAPPSRLYFYVMIAVMAVIATVTSGIVFCAGVVPWFRKNSGLAIGITMSGLSLVAAAVLPALAGLIETAGWRAGYLALSGLTLLIGLPLLIFWFRQAYPAKATGPATSVVDGMDFATAIRDRRFWLCIACFGGAALPIGGFVSQLQPLLRGDGFGPEAAAMVGSVFALSIACGRLVGGALLDRWQASTVAAVLLALPALGALLLMNGSSEAAWMTAAVAVFLLGLGQGAETDFLAFFTSRIFGMRSFATICATIGASVGCGMALGGAGFAMLYDMTGSYDAAIYASVGLYLAAALVALAIRVPPEPELGNGL